MKKNAFVAAAAAVIAALLAAPGSARAQLGDTEAWASHLSNEYRVVPNITYGLVNNWETKLDLYLPQGVDGPTVAGARRARPRMLAPLLKSSAERREIPAGYS